MEDLKEALGRIKEVELEADILAKEAKDRVHEIIRDAKEARARIIEQALERARVDGEKLKTAMESALAGEIARIEKKTLEEIEAIKKNAEKNLMKTFEFIMGKINFLQDGDR